MFVPDEVRKILWPKMLKLPIEFASSVENLDNVHLNLEDEVYQQILKDVARSRGHMPDNATEDLILKFQTELTQLICWVLSRHSDLSYYQGYNDVAATVLLVMGLQQGLHVLEKLTLMHLKRFMEKTMERVNQELFYIYALLDRDHPKLLQHLEDVELFPHFALAEYTTWYAHKYADNRKLLHRLFDYFLGSEQLVPLYLSTKIVSHRAGEIFDTIPADMGHTHKVLSTLPDDLPFEKLLFDSTKLYQQYPPESIINDVKDFDRKRKNKEDEWKIKTEACHQERERQKQSNVVVVARPSNIPLKSYKTITVVTILALGLYAFLKSSSGLN